MAELNLQAISASRGKYSRKLKKLSTKVDLTPMVDLGFLLITFFFVSTTWSRPGAIQFFLPADGPPTTASAKASLTIFPLYDNRVFYYFGNLADALKDNQFGLTNYSVNAGIGQIIRQRQSLLEKNPFFKKGGRELIVMIKPDRETSYNNIVKVLDEMMINQVSRYALMDMQEEEKQMLEAKKISE